MMYITTVRAHIFIDNRRLIMDPFRSFRLAARNVTMQAKKFAAYIRNARQFGRAAAMVGMLAGAASLGGCATMSAIEQAPNNMVNPFHLDSRACVDADGHASFNDDKTDTHVFGDISDPLAAAQRGYDVYGTYWGDLNGALIRGSANKWESTIWRFNPQDSKTTVREAQFKLTGIHGAITHLVYADKFAPNGACDYYPEAPQSVRPSGAQSSAPAPR
ncbi:MAG: hypothetical protein KGI97_04230 [Alphaproteobacteria bacterium]|nr:hypothetical protein [Alphaproteobacteria bacterium]